MAILESLRFLFASRLFFFFVFSFFFFFFLRFWRSPCSGSVWQERAVAGRGQPHVTPSPRNKYIHHCTNILIQKQHYSECLHHLCW